MQFVKFQWTLKSFKMSLNISSDGEGIYCVHMAQVV
jgi:hypothetical protein